MKTKIFVIGIVIISLLICASTISAIGLKTQSSEKDVSKQNWPPMGTVSGHVYLDLSGNVPASDIELIIVYWNAVGDQFDFNKYTDSNGYYTFGVDLGVPYQIILEVEGYRKVIPPINPIIRTIGPKTEYEINFYLTECRNRIKLPQFNLIENNLLFFIYHHIFNNLN